MIWDAMYVCNKKRDVFLLCLFFFYFLQISFLDCRIFTLRARVSHSFVINFNTSLQIACCSCSILIARKSHFSVFTFNMDFQIACSSCIILTIRTGIYHITPLLSFRSWQILILQNENFPKIFELEPAISSLMTEHFTLLQSLK